MKRYFGCLLFVIVVVVDCCLLLRLSVSRVSKLPAKCVISV